MKTQLELEQENLQIMIDKASAEFLKSQEQNRVSDFAMSNKIIPWYVGELADRLTTYRHEILEGTAKRKAIPAKVLTVLEPVVVAHYVVKCVVNYFGSKQTSIMPVAQKIANFLDTEFRMAELGKDNEAAKKSIATFIQSTSYTGDRQMKVTRDMLNKYYADVMKDKTLNFTRLALLAIITLSECQPVINNQIMPVLFTVESLLKGKDSKSLIKPLPWFQEWINSKIESGELITAYHTAMIEPPIPWSGITGGGFHSQRFKYNLIKANVDISRYYGVNMSATLSAVNRLQGVKWRVNKRVLEVMNHARQNNLRWGDLPYNRPVEKMPYPFPDKLVNELDEEEKKILKNWRIHSTLEYDTKVAEDSKFMSLVRTLGEANRFKDYPELYFSYFLDFRGRAYPVASNLHPQGTDYIKALLEFSEGKPINNLDAEMFLAMQGANSFGIDKETFINKHKWVLDNEYRIIKCAENPYHPDALWHDCKEDAWLFLAFCFEWADYRKYGANFKSHIPIAMDGSCNGLQHLSAMLFDEVGGKSVNLTNNAIKGDIYTDVADVAIKILEQHESPLAKKILEFGVTRKAVKRPVMIVPYAGTARACRKYIEEEIVSKGANDYFKDDFKEALTIYSEAVWEAIGEVILKGREIMGYLGDVARAVIKETKSPTIEWTTPNGFKVIQKRVKNTNLNIETPLGNRVGAKSLRTFVNVYTDVTAPQKHATGIAPNFVHSLDSCHLQNTINLMPEGTSLAMIHDSFGTHAADSRLLFDNIRLAFYDIYKNGDVLTNFVKQQPEIFMLEVMPTKGKLNLNEVLQSEHFFS